MHDTFLISIMADIDMLKETIGMFDIYDNFSYLSGLKIMI